MRIGFVILMISINMLMSAYAEETGDITLGVLIDEALKNNPRLVSAKKRYEAEKAMIPQASALDDPWIGIEYEQIPRKTFDFGDAPMRMYSASQMIPFPTKLFTRRSAQKSAAEASYQRYKEVEKQLIANVKSVYSGLFLVYKAIEINKENKVLLEQLEKTAATSFSLGKASQQDALKSQVEIAKIDNELIMLEQRRQVQIARLNILLNRPPEQALGTPKIGEQNVEVSLIEEYYKSAGEKRPELLAYQNEVKRQKALYSLAWQEFLPDFMIEAEQREIGSELDGWDAIVKVKVPLWFMQKQNFGVKQAKSELQMIEAEYNDVKNMVLLEVKEAHSMMESLIKLAVLYKTSFIPQAEQTLKASLTGYGAGQVDFLNLLDSQRMLLEFKLQYYGILADIEIAKADLERAVGIDLF